MRVGLRQLRSMPKSLAVRAVIALLATRKLVAMVRVHRPERLSVQERALAVGELRRLVPPPRPRELGGERIGTDTYERFLSVVARPLVQKRSRLRPKPKGRRLTAPGEPAPLHLCASAFLQEWRPERAAPMLEADLVWRARLKPRACRPEHIPKACAQSGWQVLMVTASSAAPPAELLPSSISSVGSGGRCPASRPALLLGFLRSAVLSRA